MTTRHQSGPTTITLRILGIIHMVVGLLMLPMSLVFGFTVAFIPALGAIWLIVLGFKLWRPGPRIRTQLLWTHVIALIIAGLSIAYGFFALEAARRSAEAGGGLLGTYGYLPLMFGTILGVTAIISLIVAVGLPASPNSTPSGALPGNPDRGAGRG